jgi:hypothetical protein
MPEPTRALLTRTSTRVRSLMVFSLSDDRFATLSWYGSEHSTRRVQKPDPEDVWGNKYRYPMSLSNKGLFEHHVDWVFSGD